MQVRSSSQHGAAKEFFQKRQGREHLNHIRNNLLQSQQLGWNERRFSPYSRVSPHQFIQAWADRIGLRQPKSLQKYGGRNVKNGVHVGAKQKKNDKKNNLKIDVQELFLNKKAYSYMNMIGKGGFGKVWKVQHIATGTIYAMKQMSKAIIITKRSIESIISQRQFLATLRHRFIVNMVYAFQDQQNLYIVMNIMQGGDLRYHLSKHTQFTQGQTKFMIASVLLALEYLHSKMIIHRDVKPQNIVFDRQGFAYLTDLGVAKHLRPNNGEDTSGTPGYMAPEVMFHHHHRFQVDYYAVGVVVYEIMMGKRPYLGKSREEIKQRIKERQVIIKKSDIPEGWSIEAADFVNKLLQRKPVQRLGWAGIKQVKYHPWLRQFPWIDLINGNLESPMARFYNHAQVRYRPTENDTNYNHLLDKNRMMLRKGKMQDYFEGYTYQDFERTAENTRIF